MIFSNLIVSAIFAVASASFDGKWNFRLANWNTGRIYAAQIYPGGFMGEFGRVCVGTGQQSILHEQNRKIFGNLVCEELGFGKLEFIGNEMDYYKFMTENKTLDVERLDLVKFAYARVIIR